MRPGVMTKKTTQTPAAPIRLTPIGVTGPEVLLAEHLAIDLIRKGCNSSTAFPAAVGVMGAIQVAIDTGDLQAAIDNLRREWVLSDDWWLKHHPKSNTAAEIRKGSRPGSKKWLEHHQFPNGKTAEVASTPSRPRKKVPVK